MAAPPYIFWGFRFFLPLWSDFFSGIVLMHMIKSGSCDQNNISVLRKGEKGWRKAAFFFFFFQFYIKKRKCYWSIVGLQHCVMIRCTSKFLSYTYTYIHSVRLFFHNLRPLLRIYIILLIPHCQELNFICISV